MRLLAYIDLPSGSAIFQFLIAGLLGISVAFRSFWRRIWDVLTRRGRRASSDRDASHGGASTAEDATAPHTGGAVDEPQASGHDRSKQGLPARNA